MDDVDSIEMDKDSVRSEWLGEWLGNADDSYDAGTAG
jgi:hypothetical protein